MTKSALPTTQTTEYLQPKGHLTLSLKHYGRTREEQIKINQQGLEKLRAWEQEHEKNYTEEELAEIQQTWAMVEKIIDENRSRLLFS